MDSQLKEDSSSKVSHALDASSPYYLHHSDNSSLVLVSQPLNGENYPLWSHAMMLALSVKNKVVFIDGAVKRPSKEDVAFTNVWNRGNNVALFWILNSMVKDISGSVIYVESSHEV